MALSDLSTEHLLSLVEGDSNPTPMEKELALRLHAAVEVGVQLDSAVRLIRVYTYRLADAAVIVRASLEPLEQAAKTLERRRS